ncbi:hypothetical protein HY251_18050 [bacterium]|nr:hypothetical protein [bacterium]
MGDERFRERIFRANVSSILFHDPKLDVTETILAKLNDAKWLKKCEEAKAAAPPAPPPPAPPGNQKPKDEHK